MECWVHRHSIPSTIRSVTGYPCPTSFRSAQTMFKLLIAALMQRSNGPMFAVPCYVSCGSIANNGGLMEARYVVLGFVLLGLAGCSGLDETTSRGSFSGGSAETSPPITSSQPRRGAAGSAEPSGGQTSPSPMYRGGSAPANCTPVAPCGPDLSSEKR